jgi:APA family basic amino acid/polyamine antiporter
MRHICMAASPIQGLVRTIGRWDLVAVVINGIIGAGIFGLASKSFALAGAYSLVCFVACAICVLVIVLSFAEVASRFTGTGGPYLYARDTYGSLTGFTVGWLVWIARLTAFAANCVLVPDYLAYFFPRVATGAPRAAILTGVVVILAALNVRGVRAVADAGNLLTIGKLLPLFIFAIVGLFFLKADNFVFGAPPDYPTFSKTVLLLVYAFTGFEMAVIPAGEVRDPKRDLPSALMIGLAIVVTIYLLIQTVCIGTLPGLATSQRPLADAAARFLGPWGAAMITVGIVISVGGNLNVLILAASRLLFAMGERGELPRELAVVHPRFRTPAVAVLVTTAVMLVLVLSGTFTYLITISVMVRLVGYIVTCSALPVLRRRAGAPAAMFLLRGGVAIAIAGIAVCVWLLSNSTFREAWHTLIAAAVGLAIYGLHRWLRPATALSR